MTTAQALILVYLAGIPICGTFTFFVVRAARRSEEAETRAAVRELDDVADEAGLLDSGVAVLSGLLWPWHVGLYLADKFRA